MPSDESIERLERELGRVTEQMRQIQETARDSDVAARLVRQKLDGHPELGHRGLTERVSDVEVGLKGVREERAKERQAEEIKEARQESRIKVLQILATAATGTGGVTLITLFASMFFGGN